MTSSTDSGASRATTGHPRVVNIGCGRRKLDFPEAGIASEVVGVDLDPGSQADIVHDLDRYPWPLESDAFDLIVMHDIIEHLDDVPAALREVCRIARNGGRVRIRTPHFAGAFAYGDVTHKRFFGYFAFDRFDVRHPESGWYDFRFRILERHISFPKFLRITGAAWLANRFPERWEQLFCGIVLPQNLDFVLEVVKD